MQMWGVEVSGGCRCLGTGWAPVNWWWAIVFFCVTYYSYLSFFLQTIELCHNPWVFLPSGSPTHPSVGAWMSGYVMPSCLPRLSHNKIWTATWAHHLPLFWIPGNHSSECGLSTHHECATTVLNLPCFCSAVRLTSFIPIAVEKKNR